MINKSLSIYGNGYIIDASGQSRIFKIASDNVILTDITFKNGNADYGGAIYTETSNVTISANQFMQNSAICGGAICINNTDEITITSNTFTQNDASSDGGAVCIRNSTLQVIDNLFEQNPTENISNMTFGGAIYAKNSTMTVRNNTFKSNAAYNGGAIYTVDGCNLTVTDCVFEQNSAIEYSGAICSFGDNITVVNTTFIGNTADCGGAIDTLDCSLTVTDCVFEQNSAIEYGGAIESDGDKYNCCEYYFHR